MSVEQLSQFAFEVEDPEPESGVGCEFEQQIDVTVGVGVAACNGSEHGEFADPVTLADLGDSCFVDLSAPIETTA